MAFTGHGDDVCHVLLLLLLCMSAGLTSAQEHLENVENEKGK